MSLILRCICGGEDFSSSLIHNIPVNVCKVCGVVHQNVSMNESELENFYKTSYSSEHQKEIGTRPYMDRYNHDRGVARLRHNKYKLNGTVLDVGCGNGGFVDEGRTRGLNIFGTAISNDFDGANPEWTYAGKLNSINFPSSYFDSVCYHDVLEHIVDFERNCLKYGVYLKMTENS